MKENFLLLLILLFTSCATYYIPVDSFKEQFSGIDSTKLIEVTVIGPGAILQRYLANPITMIHCVDKNGEPHQLRNSPSIETRFTYGYKNKRAVLYFDRIYVDSVAITGVQSRFVELGKTIPLDSITKIEIQDGKKDFKYTLQ